MENSRNWVTTTIGIASALISVLSLTGVIEIADQAPLTQHITEAVTGIAGIVAIFFAKDKIE